MCLPSLLFSRLEAEGHSVPQKKETNPRSLLPCSLHHEELANRSFHGSLQSRPKGQRGVTEYPAPVVVGEEGQRRLRKLYLGAVSAFT